MKTLNAILLFIIFVISAGTGLCGTVAPPYQVGTWRGFRSAAVTYTFDDNCSNQFAIAIPMFNGFDFDLTMYPVINWGPNWTALQNAAANGHEVGSHTVSHPDLSGLTIEAQTTELVNSKNTINSYIPGSQCVTIAYPYCNPSNQTLTATYYIAGRTCSGQIVPSTPSNFYQISSIICGSSGSVNSLSAFVSKFNSAVSSNGWCVFLIHGIDGDGGYSPLSSTVLNQSLQHLDANRSTFWVSTFSNVVRYIKQRNDVSVAELSATDTIITLAVTDTLDNSIFNYPITIRRPLPTGWTSANVAQNGQPVDSSIVEISSTLYVMFDAVPDGGDVVISKPLSNPAGLEGTLDAGTVMLDWDDITQSNLAGYNVYRSTVSGGPYSKLNSSLLTASDYNDVIPISTTYYYVVSAADAYTFESGYSNQAVVFADLYGDFTGDGTIYMDDLSPFLTYWLLDDCDQTSGVDIDDDCLVNFFEYALLAENWLI